MTSLTRHALPDEVFVELAAGGGGAAGTAALRAAQRSRTVLLVRGVRDHALALGLDQAGAVRRAYDLIAEVQRAEPRSATDVLEYPTVTSWALRTLKGLTGGAAPADGADLRGFASVAAAVAVRAGFPAEIEVPSVEGTVFLPSLGSATPRRATGPGDALVRSSSDGAVIEFAGERVELPSGPGQDGPGWNAVPRLPAEHQGVQVSFALDERDPGRMPGARLLGRRLTAAELGHWRSTVASAWALLVTGHAAVADEVRSLIRVLTPLSAPAEGESSATSKEAVGNVGVSTPRSPEGLAVTLAHEVQHVKLSTLLDIVQLTRPDDGSRYYAPWREDPRPLDGLLQGAYAHLGIAAFWSRERVVQRGERAARADVEFARWREATARTTRTLLESGRLTPAGERFVTEMDRVVRRWCGEPVPAQAVEQATRAAERHRERWLRRASEESVSAS